MMSKREKKLFELKYELVEIKHWNKRFDSNSYLASALHIATKGTKLETDAAEIIKSIIPNFFEGEVSPA